MRTAIGMVVVMVALTGCVMGCATLGIGEQPPEQAALEAASGIMVVEYLDLKDQNLSRSELASALITVADDYLETVYPQSGYRYMTLVQDFVTRISNGKVNPNVGFVYYLIQRALQETDTAALVDLPQEEQGRRMIESMEGVVETQSQRMTFLDGIIRARYTS